MIMMEGIATMISNIAGAMVHAISRRVWPCIWSGVALPGSAAVTNRCVKHCACDGDEHKQPDPEEYVKERRLGPGDRPQSVER